MDPSKRIFGFRIAKTQQKGKLDKLYVINREQNEAVAQDSILLNGKPSSPVSTDN